ncbi:MAG: hypothetical protein IPK79_02335 [Vampirovibrionales bacterium]|nr:hypothetical protein [Vampirovibrionales bacterium]
MSFSILDRFIRKPQVMVEFVCFRQQAAVLAYDLENRRRLRPLSTCPSRRILLFVALRADTDVTRLFRGLMRKVLRQNPAMLHSLQPFALRLILQSHLDQMRRAHPDSRQAIDACKIFLLNEERCYSLNESADEEVTLYRRGQALTYHLGPAHFLPIEANDALLIASPTVMTFLQGHREYKRLDSFQALETLCQTLQARCGAGPLWETSANYLVAFRFASVGKRPPGEPTRNALRVGRLMMTLLYGGAALLAVGLIVWFWLLRGG